MQGGGSTPRFEHSLDIDVVSDLFAPYGVQKDNYPPFELAAMLELTCPSCTTVCKGGTVGRCIAVAGLMDDASKVGLAYYCLPVDMTMYVFETPNADQWQCRAEAAVLSLARRLAGACARCDGKGAILTVIKCTDGYVFGGFADASWQFEGGYCSSPTALLFHSIIRAA